MGMPASQAITSLKAVLSNVIKPTDEAEKTAARLGIQFNTTSVSTKGLSGFLWDTYNAAHGNIDKLGSLFGSVEGLNGVMLLGADKVKYRGAIEEAHGRQPDRFDRPGDIRRWHSESLRTLISG